MGLATTDRTRTLIRGSVRSDLSHFWIAGGARCGGRTWLLKRLAGAHPIGVQ
jgi:hypothetical protein